MKLIKSNFEILEQEPGLDGIYKAIEYAGRTCYKSHDKITEDSAKKFVDMLINRGHTAMLEHGTVYLTVRNPDMFKDATFTKRLRNGENFGNTENIYYVNNYIPGEDDPYNFNGMNYITTNYRYIYENNLEHWLMYISEPTEHHAKRVTVKFTSNIHFYKDITRHRKMSFAIESTRYCNYSKGKFDNQLTFLIPAWVDLEEGSYGIGHDFIKGNFIHHLDSDTYIFPETTEDLGVQNFIHGLYTDERKYLKAIEYGWRPEQAAELLPQATKADIVMTGFVSDWNYIFDIRADGKAGVPHPEVKRLMKPVKEEFIKRGYINEESN